MARNKRRRFEDREHVGHSVFVPKRRHEHPKARHDRRKDSATAMEAELATFCATNRCTLSITNERHHWKITRGRYIAEWWPSTAKLVLDRRYRHGIHAHDVFQVMAILASRWDGVNCKHVQTVAFPWGTACRDCEAVLSRADPDPPF